LIAVSSLIRNALITAGIASVALAQSAPDPHRQFVTRYCVTCHNDKLKTAGLILDKADIAHPAAEAETWEKVITKLGAEAIPPAGLPRPSKAEADSLIKYFEMSIDTAAAATPNPGHLQPHRMNRAEYGNAVRDLLGFDVDVATLLPADDENAGFDNIGGKFSPVLLERYMSAAWNVSREAVGDQAILPSTVEYRARPDLSQNGHIEGLPLGTQGGLITKHNFPLDGNYEFRIMLWRTAFDNIRGLEEHHQVEVTIDGVRAYLGSFGGPEDFLVSSRSGGDSATQIDARLIARVPVKAGVHTIGVAFIKQTDAISDERLQPFERTTEDILNMFGYPHLDRLKIMGPYDGKPGGDTVSRRRIFVCRPASAADEVPCARKIISGLATRAYRRPVTDSEMETLLTFFQQGRNKGSFESGIEMSLRRILADPKFVLRLETDSPNAAVNTAYRVTDLDLASRLSFFLWSSIPDEQLLTLAQQGKLKDKTVLEAQVKRMLADPRSDALTKNFAGQWLYLRNMRNQNPDPQTFPDWDDNLRQGFQKETELFFTSIVREDHGVNDLLTADYTFINDRLARHYGIPGIVGGNFRRVTLTDPARFGLLGKGSTLVVTSYATRTSPVLRGKFILTNILGTPPPPPPPNVPALPEPAEGAIQLSMRQRMEQHRANPACAVCHKIMDPLGFAMENFDGVGRYRTRDDDGKSVDSSGQMPSGRKIEGVVGLRAALTANPEIFAGIVTEKLLAYALGRALDYQDKPTVRAILHQAAPSGYKFSEIISAIVESTPFEMREKSGPDQKMAMAGN